jgi:hypothetical protein
MAVMVLVFGLFWHIDVFELPGVVAIEHSEAGEVAIAFLLVIPAFFVDRLVARQRAHDTQLQAERLSVLRMTMRTVQDIVSNALMSLYMFRIEAEPSVSPQSLEQFDRIIAETAAKLKATADLDHVAETQMAMGWASTIGAANPLRSRRADSSCARRGGRSSKTCYTEPSGARSSVG